MDISRIIRPRSRREVFQCSFFAMFYLERRLSSLRLITIAADCRRVSLWWGEDGGRSFITAVHCEFAKVVSFDSLQLKSNPIWSWTEKNSHLIIYFPTSEGVSEVSEQANEWAQWSEQDGASEWVSGASEQANGRASGPVLHSGFLVILAHGTVKKNILTNTFVQERQKHRIFPHLFGIKMFFFSLKAVIWWIFRPNV